MMKIIKLLSLVLLLLVFSNLTYAQDIADANEVMHLFESLSGTGNMVNTFDPSKEMKLPIGIVRKIGDKPYVAAVTNAEFSSNRSTVDVFFQFFFPGSKIPLAFGAKGVGFHSHGLEVSDGVKLMLMKDCTVLDNGKYKLKFLSKGGTYAQFSCKGIEKIHLEGIIEFSSDFAVKADGVGVLSTKFAVDISDANNILVDVSLDPFQILPIKGFVFNVKHATLDFSDRANPSSVEFPLNYFPEGLSPELWRGIALSDIDITFPKELSPSSSNMKLSLRNLILDEDGVSMKLETRNVIGGSESKDQMGWPFSISGFNLELVKNKLIGAGFNGIIKVPYLNDEPMDYNANVSYDENHNRNYNFALGITTDKEYSFPCLSAKIKLNKSSSIEVSSFNGKLIPKAILSGEMSIDRKPLKMDVKFEELMLTTVSPYIGVSRLSLNDQSNIASLAGFSLLINNLDTKKSGGDLVLDINSTVALHQSESTGSSKGFSISGTSQISMTAGKNNSALGWGIKRFDLKEIALSASVANTLSFEGKIQVKEDDPVYGDGFGGQVSCSIAGIIKGVDMGIRFGKKDSYHYWYAGADVGLNIPLGTTPLFITSFKGGVYYHMKEKSVSYGKINIDDYIPEKDVALGLKSGVGMTLAKAVDANTMLKVEFSSSGGILALGFDGEVKFINTGTSSAKLKAQMQMSYNFKKNEFYSSAAAYVNVLNIIRGTGADDLVGNAELYFAPGSWYVKIGTPAKPIQLEAFGLLQAKSYFIAGDVNESFSLPDECRELLGKVTPPDMTSLKGGKCFGFGSCLSMSAGGKCGPFYAKLKLGGGLDVMLRDVKSTCKGRSGSMGINGWYALGQVYVYMQGNVGIKFRSRSFDILDVGAAALLQAELPNPTWINGTIGGRFRILGGLVRGNIRYHFEVGERCIPEESANALADIQVIGDVTPKGGAKEVDVFASPQVAFNMALNKTFSLDTPNSKGKSYRVLLDGFKVTANGREVAGSPVWNGSGDVLVLNTDEILPPQSKVTMNVKVRWQEKEPQGDWKDCSHEGKLDVEEKSFTFETGKAPDYIVPSNVEYTYPQEQQCNFYRDEYGKGYVKMKRRGMEYLFNKKEKGVEWNLIAKFNSDKGAINVPFEFNPSTNEVGFTIPAQLELAKVYELQLVKFPSQVRGLDRNVTSTTTEAYKADTLSISTASKEAKGELTVDEEKLLYAINFRTSKYRALGEKLSQIDVNKFFRILENTPYTRFYLDENLDEGFDNTELEEGGAVRVQAVADGSNPWYSGKIKPFVYSTCKAVERQDGVVPPVNSCSITSANMMDWNMISRPQGGRYKMRINYNFGLEVYRDFSALQDYAAAAFFNKKPICPSLEKLVFSTLPFTDRGAYPVRITYVRPGGEVTTSNQVNLTY
ncbi:hypothetical protein [Alistipes sp. ZOR0009]|uniref:hypothetical protein n=1 Tax=Alistipes sp. ZOR0009 TaxID=1339253 RepID=UPI000B09D44C|nr:hypothetical protein [Alistipes sp. ZOR0009]